MMQSYTNRVKPKNFSRKGYICTCLCPVYCDNKKIEDIIVKYELEKGNSNNTYVPKLRKNQWATYQYWGKFKKIIELPLYFNNIVKYYYVTSSFTRDGIQMPFVYRIEIEDLEKYLIEKKKIDRKDKLNKIINL